MKQNKNIKTANLTTSKDIAKFLKDSISLKPNDLVISDTKWKYLVRTKK